MHHRQTESRTRRRRRQDKRLLRDVRRRLHPRTAETSMDIDDGKHLDKNAENLEGHRGRQKECREGSCLSEAAWHAAYGWHERWRQHAWRQHGPGWRENDDVGKVGNDKNDENKRALHGMPQEWQHGRQQPRTAETSMDIDDEKH